MKINICTSDIYRGDAIGNFSLQLLDFLTGHEFDVRLFARHFDATSTPMVFHFDLLESMVEPDDLIFAQYSIFESGNEVYSRLSNRKIVYYHGITPPHYFADIDQLTEKGCREGILQAPLFSDFDFYFANSRFMLGELLERLSSRKQRLKHLEEISAVAPPVIDLESRFKMTDRGEGELGPASFSRYLLYVGRVAPHKKLDDLIDWFRSYLQLDPGAALVIVGGGAPPAYKASLCQRIESDPALIGHVEFRGHVSDGELYQLYRQAECFVTLSEHEGFCVPLVEAMGVGLPVFARGNAAVPETLGRRDLMLVDQGLDIFAREVFAVLSNPAEKSSLIQRQNAVYEETVRRSSGEILLSAIRSVMKLPIIT